MPPQWRIKGDWGGFRGWGWGGGGMDPPSKPELVNFVFIQSNKFILKGKKGRASLSRKLAVVFNFVEVGSDKFSNFCKAGLRRKLNTTAT